MLSQFVTKLGKTAESLEDIAIFRRSWPFLELYRRYFDVPVVKQYCPCLVNFRRDWEIPEIEESSFIKARSKIDDAGLSPTI